MYIHPYDSHLGRIWLAEDGDALCGLWFEGQRYFPEDLLSTCEVRDTDVFARTAEWLNTYFSGGIPRDLPPLRPAGTPFQQTVWQELCRIPYGAVTTYGRIAAQLSEKSGRRTSPRAVGGAVGHNPISILIPCHRVLGANGSLTGYAGGTERKARLLSIEHREG